MAPPEGSIDFLRHTLAVLAYRAAKILRDAPDGYATTRIGERIRTPVEILAHMGDLMEWGLSMARGREAWRDSPPLPWREEVDRFLTVVSHFDEALASGDPVACPPEKLFQGPIADAISHVGQLALLRRVGGVPIRGENYFQAEIATGRLGLDQPPPRREFD